ncbi:MAG: NAD-dependent epimerase/dehydratase family protein [Phycisphaerae bacterium]|nr:NAD-dependent epimerase/dehydratase family protein [Phycisphaerae bacterium]
MRILVIGGTRFLGAHFVDAALARGHALTLFNRGQSAATPRAGVENVVGDRDGGLDVLKGHQWDAVLDTCGYYPRIVRASAELLAGAAEHYTFVSSISVYADLSKPGVDEESPVGRIADETIEEITEESYGPLKALCERAVEKLFPRRTLIVRPGLIVGPLDRSDRFTYWVMRVARGGEVLAPAPAYAPVQLIDVRDLAGWILRCMEKRVTGVFNGTGPTRSTTMGELLECCRRVCNPRAAFTWIEPEFLIGQEVTPWIELPVWMPETAEAGLYEVRVGRAIAAGLTFRMCEETVRDTLEWARTRPADYEWRAGMKAEKEAAVLQAWADEMAER